MSSLNANESRVRDGSKRDRPGSMRDRPNLYRFMSLALVFVVAITTVQILGPQ